MISIIVCSRSSSLFENLAKNIQKTIGVPYEVIRIENSNGSFSISAAYNKGASESKYSFLCFVHEDVRFDSNEWGVKIVNHFLNDKDTGLIGVAGGVYKKRMVSGWAEFETDELSIKRTNLIQHYKYSVHQPVNLYENPVNELRSQVVSLDGVFLCTTKHIWRLNRFDERLLKGFHGYDLDFSLQVGRSKKLFVVYDVLVEHFSEGICDLSWYANILAVHKKWRKRLPIAIDFSIAEKVDIYNCDWNKVRYVLDIYVRSGSSYFTLFKLYNSLFCLINYRGKKHAVVKDYWAEWFKISKFFILSAAK